MFSNFLKKITDAIDGPSNTDGGGGSASAAPQTAFSFSPIGASRLSPECAEWAHVFSHEAATAEHVRRYAKEQQRNGEGGAGDYDAGVAMRAAVAVGSPFPNARLVAYDAARQLAAILADGPCSNFSVAAEPSACGGAAPALARRIGEGSFVHFVSFGGAASASSASLQRSVRVPEGEDWREMVFLEGYQVVALRSPRVLCIVDARSATSSETLLFRGANMSPFARSGGGGGPFGAAAVLSPPMERPSAEGGASFVTLTAMCRAPPIGLGSIAVGTSSGRVLFAPLSPSTPDATLAWRKTSADVRAMLDAANIPALACCREATRRYFDIRFMSAVARRREKEGRGDGGLWAGYASAFDAVQCVAAYPSDPNSLLVSTRNSHGLAKLYVVEGRLSAVFLLPHCYATASTGASLRGAAPAVNPAALREDYSHTFVTAAVVTAGGGFVVGLTNTFSIVVWSEKKDKQSDRSVPPLASMDLLRSHPLYSHLSSLPRAAPMGDGDSDASDDEEADESGKPASSSRLAHRVLLSRPEDMFLLATVTPAAHAALTASDASPPSHTPPSASASAAAAAQGEAASSKERDSPYLTLFIPTQQVQFGGSDATAALPTEHCTVMTEVRFEATTMAFVTARHVPLQGHSAPLTCAARTRAKGWPHCLFNAYPVRLSVCPAVSNAVWPSERTCGLLLTGPSPSPQRGGGNTTRPPQAHADPNNAFSAANARLSVKMSGGGNGSALRGSVRGSVVFAADVTAASASSPTSAEGFGEAADSPPPPAADGSPASLAAFFVCATAGRTVEMALTGLPSSHRGDNSGAARAAVALRSPLGSVGAACVHRVVERFAVGEEEAACGGGSYFTASYRSVPMGGVGGEVFPALCGAGESFDMSRLSTTLGATPRTNTSNQLCLLPARHRRLLCDAADALAARGGSSHRHSSHAHAVISPHSSSSCTHLLAGGGRNPFLLHRDGQRRRPKPYVGLTPDDVGMLAIFRSAYAASFAAGGGQSMSGDAPLLRALRFFPMANAHSAAPLASVLQALVGLSSRPPPLLPTAPHGRIASSPTGSEAVPLPPRGRAPFLTEERTVGPPQRLFEGAMVATLVERRAYTHRPSRASADAAEREGESETASDGAHSRCRVTYSLRITTQRLFPDATLSSGDDDDSDADNEAYEAYGASPSCGGTSPSVGAHSAALSSGEVALPLWESLVPLCCPTYHPSMVDSDGCAAMPHPAIGSYGPHTSPSFSSQQQQAQSLPTVVDFRIIYGSLRTVGNGGSGGDRRVRGPRRLFSPNEGLSLALALSDNTVIITSLLDVAALNEVLLREGGALPAAGLRLPEGTLCVPPFLFPAQSNVTAIDVFSVPIVVPVAAARPQTPPPHSHNAPADAAVIPLFDHTSAAFAAAHALVIAVGLSNGSLLMFDASKEAVLSCTSIEKGVAVALLRAATPANGAYSYSPAPPPEPKYSETEGAPVQQPSPIALHANPFAPVAFSRPSALHNAVYKCRTLPCFAAVRPRGAAEAAAASSPHRPLYHWYPRTALALVPPQIPSGREGAAAVGGCGRLRIKVRFGGGVVPLSEAFAAALSSSEGSSEEGVRPIFSAQLLDVVGHPLCGVAIGVGPSANEGTIHSDGSGNATNSSLFVRIDDTQLLSEARREAWAPIPTDALAKACGLAVTRDLTTGHAAVSLLSPSASPCTLIDGIVGIPLGCRLFNTRRISCVSVVAEEAAHYQASSSSSTSSSFSCFNSNAALSSGVSVEVDALGDVIRHFAIDAAPVPVAGGSLPIGGVSSGDVSRAVGRHRHRHGHTHGHSSHSGAAAAAVPVRARVPQLPSLHDFAVSRAVGSSNGKRGEGPSRQLAAPILSAAERSLMLSLIRSADGVNSKGLLAALEAAFEASATARSYPSLLVTLTSASNTTDFDAKVATVALHGTIRAVQAGSLNWVRATLFPPPTDGTAPSAAAQPHPITVPSPLIASLSLRSLLAVAVRHNNLCERDLSEWARCVLAGDRGLAEAKAKAAIPQPKKEKVSFEDRMRRIEKGLPPEPTSAATAASAPAEGTSADAADALNAVRTIESLYRGPGQPPPPASSSPLPSSTKCPYSDFVFPNTTACFAVLSTSAPSHPPDDLIAAQLGARIDRAARGEDEEGHGHGADDDDDAAEEGLGELAHVEADRQRPYVFVAFTTETSARHPFADTIVDAEEGLYGHRELMRAAEGSVDGAPLSSFDGAEGPQWGLLRHGGPYRSHIAVFDLSMAVHCASSATAAAPASLVPLFVYPIPTSAVPAHHVLTGFDVCWAEGSAHCYLTSAPPAARAGGGVVELPAGAVAAPLVAAASLGGRMHQRAHSLAHIVLDEGLPAPATAYSSAGGFVNVDDQTNSARNATALAWEEAGDEFRTNVNPFAVCDMVGLSAVRRAPLEATLANRAQREIDASRAGGSAMAAIGRPRAVGRDVIGFTVPPPPSNLSATQKEQGFFKRLITSGYTDQLDRVEKSALTACEEADFGAFFAAAETAALRNATPAERRALLLRNGGGGGGSGGGPMGGINETKEVMNENLRLLSERGEKIDRLRLKTREMHEEAATFADLSAQLKAKAKRSWF